MVIQRVDERLKKVGIPSELQFTYQSERNTLQTNFILRGVISANRDIGKTVYAAFLDVQKCFNSVWHDGLIYKLISSNIQTTKTHIDTLPLISRIQGEGKD